MLPAFQPNHIQHFPSVLTISQWISISLWWHINQSSEDVVFRGTFCDLAKEFTIHWFGLNTFLFIILILPKVEYCYLTVKENEVVTIKQDTKKIILIRQMVSKITMITLFETCVCSFHWHKESIHDSSHKGILYKLVKRIYYLS